MIKFMSNISNSLTRYYNIKNQRKGPIFLPQFKSKRILSQEHLIYVSRYIHTNSYAHGVVKNSEEIFDYPYSSIKAYLNLENSLKINTKLVFSSFGDNTEKYKRFILKNAEDQKTRELLKYTKSWMR